MLYSVLESSDYQQIIKSRRLILPIYAAVCSLYNIKPPLYAGKTGGGAVAKNKKKKTAGTEKNSSSGGYKIPKKKSAVEPDSEDEARGTTFYGSS